MAHCSGVVYRGIWINGHPVGRCTWPSPWPGGVPLWGHIGVWLSSLGRCGPEARMRWKLKPLLAQRALTCPHWAPDSSGPIGPQTKGVLVQARHPARGLRVTGVSPTELWASGPRTASTQPPPCVPCTALRARRPVTAGASAPSRAWELLLGSMTRVLPQGLVWPGTQVTGQNLRLLTQARVCRAQSEQWVEAPAGTAPLP